MSRSIKPRVLGLGLGSALAVTAFAGATAQAGGAGKITPVDESHVGATQLARTIMANHKLLLSGRFAAVPPDNHPNAVSTKRLAGFAVNGKAYAILTSGCATLATRPKHAGLPGCKDNGVPLRGTRDLTILRITVRVPKSANCLSFRFRYLSQEYPKFVGTNYNDGFIAELDQTTWNSGASGNVNDPHISAPRDFAKDSKGHIITVNAAGPATMKAANAAGTTYGGATGLLRASTRISPGIHSLFLSIFDQGDREYDSAAFVDDLTINHQSVCKSGVSKFK